MLKIDLFHDIVPTCDFGYGFVAFFLLTLKLEENSLQTLPAPLLKPITNSSFTQIVTQFMESQILINSILKCLRITTTPFFLFF